MKPLIILITFLFSSLAAFCQGVTEERYMNDLQTANTLQDTVVAWCTYKTTTTLKLATASRLLDETLKSNYPLWVEIEKGQIEYDSTYNIRTLKELVDQSRQKTALHKYSRFLLRSQQIYERKSDKVDNVVLSADLSNPKNLIFNYYLKGLQHIELNQIDSFWNCITLIDNLDQEIYTALQLELIAEGLNKFSGRLKNEQIGYIKKGISLSESLNEYNQRAVIINAQTAHLKKIGDIEGAMKSALKFIEFSKKTGNYKKMITGYINLSAFHQDQGRFDETYDYIYKARAIAEKNNNSSYIEKSYVSEAHAKMSEKKYEKAIDILLPFIDSKHTGGLLFEVQKISTLISCYYYVSKLDSAYYYYKILEKKDPDNSTGYLSYAKTFVTKYLIQNGEFELAQEYIIEAMADAVAYDDLSSKSIVLKAQSELNEELGNYKNALESYKKHYDIEMDFRSSDLASATAKIQLESDFKNEKKIIELTNEKEKLEITSQRNQALLLGGLALLSTISAFGFYLFLRRKNKQINAQNNKLEELNTVKDTLFQIIGHDLKKPTINFRNVSKNINYLLEKEDYKRLKLLGEEVDQDAKSLYNLTDNLLNWALMQKDAISIKPESVNVHEIVNYNFDLFATLSKKKRIILENHIGKDVLTMVDRNSLDTIIRNLIDNAIKYTSEGGHISLESKTTDGTVRISISDNGIGMDQDEIDAINNNQSIVSKKGTADEKGSGIGLQLIKNLIKRNKGFFKVQSAPGDGSVIFIDLPIGS